MGIFILQALLLLLIAFLIGGAIGCLLRRVGGKAKPAGKASESAAAGETTIMTIPDPMTGLTVIDTSTASPAPAAPAPRKAAKSAATKASRPKPSGTPKAAAAKQAAPKQAAPRQAAPKRAAPAKRAAPVADDDLTLIGGIGKLNEKRLKEAGVTSFAQIAAWTKKDIAAFDEKLSFKGRIAREDWVGQAKSLARGTSKAPSARKPAPASKK